MIAVNQFIQGVFVSSSYALCVHFTHIVIKDSVEVQRAESARDEKDQKGAPTKYYRAPSPAGSAETEPSGQSGGLGRASRGARNIAGPVRGLPD